MVKNPPANAGDVGDTKSLGQKDPLEKEMATHSSILVWEIPWTKEPGELQYIWCHKRNTRNSGLAYSLTSFVACF